MKRLIIAMRLGVIAGIIFALAATAFPASQTGESQVHIVPRAGPEAKHNKDPRERAVVDPALKTHTNPMKVVVDLVLVPVSVSDPHGPAGDRAAEGELPGLG